MIYKDLPCIIKNSKNATYKFSLDSFNNLIVENYNEPNEKSTKFIYKQFILDYSVDIDNKDKIHVAFVTMDNLLKYSVLDLPNMEINIIKVSSKDYKINHITIKIISSSIHIFYMLQNKYNTDIWTMTHSFFHNNVWISKKLGEMIYNKNSVPYSIDLYKNNIYILYQADLLNQYYIKKFNVPFSLWSTVETNINLMHCKNSELFINSLGIGFICYTSSINKSINTLIKFRDFNSSSSIWSDDLFIRTAYFDYSLPSILCTNDAIFLFWKESETLHLAKSFYNANSLAEKKAVLYKNMVTSSKYISNNFSYDNNKSNFLFLIKTSPPSTILNDIIVKNFLKVDSITVGEKFNPLNGPLKETLKIIAKNSNLGNKSITIKDEGISDKRETSMNDLNTELVDDKISMVENLQLTLKTQEENIEHFKNKLSMKDEEIENLKSTLNSKNDEIENLNNIIISNNAELKSLNKTYFSLKNTVAEKNFLIQELHCKIQEIENDSYKDMPTQKKKSFIDIFKKGQ